MARHYTKVIRSTKDSTVVFELFGDMTAPPIFKMTMSPEEADEMAEFFGNAAANARLHTVDSDR